MQNQLHNQKEKNFHFQQMEKQKKCLDKLEEKQF